MNYNHITYGQQKERGSRTNVKRVLSCGHEGYANQRDNLKTKIENDCLIIYMP